MDTVASPRLILILTFLVALLAVLVTSVPAQADKGFSVTCDNGEAYFLGSGSGLHSAKKDMDSTRGRWGTADANNSGPDKTNSSFTLIPVSWTITVVDTVTGAELVTDFPLVDSNGHRNQATIECTFTSELPPSPPQFPNPGLATHTLVMVQPTAQG